MARYLRLMPPEPTDRPRGRGPSTDQRRVRGAPPRPRRRRTPLAAHRLPRAQRHRRRPRPVPTRRRGRTPAPAEGPLLPPEDDRDRPEPAKRDGGTRPTFHAPLHPAGLTAANMLGLSAQNPGRPNTPRLRPRRPGPAQRDRAYPPPATRNGLSPAGRARCSNSSRPREYQRLRPPRRSSTAVLITAPPTSAALPGTELTEPPRVRAMLGALGQQAGPHQRRARRTAREPQPAPAASTSARSPRSIHAREWQASEAPRARRLRRLRHRRRGRRRPQRAVRREGLLDHRDPSRDREHPARTARSSRAAPACPRAGVCSTGSLRTSTCSSTQRRAAARQASHRPDAQQLTADVAAIGGLALEGERRPQGFGRIDTFRYDSRFPTSPASRRLSGSNPASRAAGIPPTVADHRSSPRHLLHGGRRRRPGQPTASSRSR